jgi:hypothetical protein
MFNFIPGSNIEVGKQFPGKCAPQPFCATLVTHCTFPDGDGVENQVIVPTVFCFLYGDQFYGLKEPIRLHRLGIYAGRSYPDGYLLLEFCKPPSVPIMTFSGMIDVYDPYEIEQYADLALSFQLIRLLITDFETQNVLYAKTFYMCESFIDALVKTITRTPRNFDMQKLINLQNHTFRQIWNASIRWEWDSKEEELIRLNYPKS